MPLATASLAEGPEDWKNPSCSAASLTAPARRDTMDPIRMAVAAEERVAGAGHLGGEEEVVELVWGPSGSLLFLHLRRKRKECGEKEKKKKDLYSPVQKQ